MSIFRAAAFIAFVIAAILALVFGEMKDPVFWLAAGLAAFCLAGASFDRNLN